MEIYLYLGDLAIINEEEFFNIIKDYKELKKLLKKDPLQFKRHPDLKVNQREIFIRDVGRAYSYLIRDFSIKENEKIFQGTREYVRRAVGLEKNSLEKP